MALCSSETQIFLVAYLLRLFLIFFGDIFTPPGVKYQDIDYEVFTNASRHIYGGGTAFDQETDYLTKYRYTPILAWILQPNIFLFFDFGKLIFVTFDVMGAYLLLNIMKMIKKKTENCLKYICCVWLFNPMIFTISSRGSCDSINIFLVLSTFYFLLKRQWIFSGIVYGAAVHLRIYPFIYALSFVLFIYTFKHSFCSVVVFTLSSLLSFLSP